jgi:hypothetical protein
MPIDNISTIALLNELKARMSSKHGTQGISPCEWEDLYSRAEKLRCREQSVVTQEEPLPTIDFQCGC